MLPLLLSLLCAVDVTPEHVDLTPSAEWMLVAAGGPEWPAVDTLAWNAPLPAPASHGLTDATWWGRFTLSNPSPETVERWITLDHTTLEHITLREIVDGSAARVHVSGRQEDPRSRELHRRGFAFKVVLAPGESRRMVLSVTSENGITVPLGLWTLPALMAHDALEDALRMLLYGVVLGLALMNLFIFLFTRQRSYLFYALSHVALAGWNFGLDGTIHLEFPWVVQHATRVPFIVFPLGYCVVSTLFVRIFLDLPSTPKLDRVARINLAIVPIYFAVLMMGVPWRVMNAVGVPLFLATIVGTLTVAVIRWRQGHAPAKFVVGGWAWLSLTFGSSAATVIALGGTLWNPTIRGLTAAAGEAIFLSLALADETRRRTAHIAALQRASARFVPQAFLNLLGHRDLPEVHHGEQISRVMTVWFSDVRSFTSIVEGLTPQETMELVNAYLTRMEPIITRHHGVIDKYIGDAVMALFDRADDALLAATEAIAELERYNAGSARPIRIGVGLHTGPLVLGVVGSAERLACTVLGDSVNLASRVEGLTRTYGAQVLISGATHAALADPARWTLREVDRVQVKGKAEAVTLLQVLDAQPELARSRTRYDDGYRAYREGRFDEAAAIFRACPVEDAAAVLMAARSDELKANPPQSWDGVVKLHHK